MKYAPTEAQKLYQHAKTILDDFSRCNLFKDASAMAYVTLFSLVPSIAVVLALISAFEPFLGKESGLVVEIQGFILSNLATGSGEQAIEYLTQFISNLNFTRIGLTGFAGMLVTLILLLRQIEFAFNRIWQIQKGRHFWTRIIYFWLFLTLGSFIVILAIGFTAEFQLSNLNPFGDGEKELGWFSSFVPTLATFCFYSLLYKIVPNTFVPIRYAAIGAIPATIVCRVAFAFYGVYAVKFTHYQAAYGALAAIPSFLMWLYLLWLISLAGAVIAWRAEQGFAASNRMEDDSDSSPEALMRNLRLRELSLPLSLMVIYDRFRNGAGEGITGKEISQKLNFPAFWVAQTLESLLAFNFIVAAESENLESGDPLLKKYFPSKPADKFSTEELAERIKMPTSNWLKEWTYDWPLNLQEAAEKVWLHAQDKTGGASMSFDKLLGSFEAKGVKTSIKG